MASNLEPHYHLNTEHAYRLAAAAYANARGLAEDARVLAGSGSFGRATALAVVGIEECGKARIYIQFMTGYWAKSEKALSLALADHVSKQMCVALPRAALSDLLAVIPEEELAAVCLPFFAELADASAQTDLTAARAEFEVAVTGLFNRYAEPMEAVAKRVRLEMESRRIQVQHQRALQKLKHNGLYVDLDPQNRAVTQPSDIGSDVYQAQAAQLAELIDETGSYLEMCGSASDVAELSSLVARLRRARPEAPEP